MKDRQREGEERKRKGTSDNDQPKKWAGQSGQAGLWRCSQPYPRQLIPRLYLNFCSESGHYINLELSGMQTLLPKDLCGWQKCLKIFKCVSPQLLLGRLSLLQQMQEKENEVKRHEF